MPVITLTHARLAYGSQPLLDDADFQLDGRERIGLIGRNGCGKSSLLRVLAGRGELDDGEVWRAPGLAVAHVAQEPALDPDASVYDTVAQGLGAAGLLLADFHHATARLAANADDTAALAEVDRLHAGLDATGGWTLGHRVDNVLSRLALDPDLPVGTLSGGWQKRVALAQALATEPDVLLLDEPTNHLDLAAIGWLEDLLRGFPGAVVCVTHDRRFLDTVATRIVELDRGRLQSFPGSFAAYRERKAKELADEAVVNAKFDKLLAQEETWIRKGIEARRTRNEGRVRRLDALRSERAARRERIGHAALKLDAGEKSGRMVAELDAVTKGYDGRVLIAGFTTRIVRGDRIGLIGPNGIGKTTLLKLILGEIEPDAGRVRRGANLAVAYYDQLRATLDPDVTLQDAISPGADFLEIAGVRRHVLTYLGEFLFPPERARSPVRSLSGGERNRLLLARLFSQPANVLVLDEPTNDLDIETLELLETLLQDYPGTIFLVSHDREFLDNVITQAIVFEGDGRLLEFAGGYSDWAAYRAAREAEAAAEQRPTAAGRATAAQRRAAAAPVDSAPPRRGSGLSFSEQKELAGLPQRIDALEAKCAALRERFADPALYRDAAVDVRALHAEQQAQDAELAAALARWEALEARAAAG